MKKSLLVLSLALIGVIAYGQQLRPGLRSYGPINTKALAIALDKPPAIPQHNFPVTPAKQKGDRFISIIDIGTSGDALSYGYLGGQRAILKYDPTSETITHIHRMGGELDPGGNVGDLGYDISTDFGQSFTNMVEVYQQEGDNPACYPQHVLFHKPINNTLNDFIAYLAPTPDDSNEPNGWGGYIHGLVNITSSEPAENTIVASEPAANHFHNTPEDMCTSANGDVWAIDINLDCTSGEPQYTGYLLVTHGFWNADTESLDFEETLLECPMVEGLDRPLDAKITFAPQDNNIGYIVVLGNNGELSFCENALYPIVWKTTNGGTSWGEPEEIQIGGPNGISYLKNNLLTNQQIENIFEPPYPSRDEIVYSTAFDMGITVEQSNNLNIAVGVGVLNDQVPYELITQSPYYSIVDIYFDDYYSLWSGLIIDHPKQFRTNIIPEMPEDNRVQISRTFNGDRLFVAYIDTHLEDVGYNNYPDIMCRGIISMTKQMTCVDSAGIFIHKATNVTSLTEGMWQSYYMNMADIVMDNPNYYEESYYIPFSYQDLGLDYSKSTIQYKYITDFNMKWWDFLCYYPGIEDIKTTKVVVSRNHPNPFTDKTDIDIDIPAACNVSIVVYNSLSQVIYEKDYGSLNAGLHKITLRAADLQPGISFYSIKAGDQQITRKLIVQ